MSTNLFNVFKIIGETNMGIGDPIFSSEDSVIPNGFVKSIDEIGTTCVLFSPHYLPGEDTGEYMFDPEILEEEAIEELFDECVAEASDESKNFWEEFNNSILEVLEHEHDDHIDNH